MGLKPANLKRNHCLLVLIKGDKGTGCCVEWGLMELSLVRSGLAELLGQPVVLSGDGL
jgi:hypothetical protein